MPLSKPVLAAAALFAAGISGAATAQVTSTFTGNIDGTEPQAFEVDDSTCTVIESLDHFYETFPAFVTETGNYAYSDQSISFDLDMQLTIYTPTYDPSNVLTNCVTRFDDSGTVALEAGVQYVFVVQPLFDSSFNTGDWEFDLNGPGQVIEGTAVSLELAPGAIDFGEVRVGTASAPLAVTLDNSGGATLNVTGLTAASEPFERTGGTCGDAPFSVDAGQSCTLTYTFSPSATGATLQNLAVESNAPSSPDPFELAGTGIESAIDLSPDSVDFGEVRLGATSNPLEVTVSNAGDAVLNVTGLTAASDPFARTGGTCGDVPFSVDAGQSCTLVFTYRPLLSGEASQALLLESDAPSSPDTINLRGSPRIIAVPALNPYGMILLTLLIALLALRSARPANG